MSDVREQRNAVFSGGTTPIDPRFPTTTQADRVKADFGLDIPSEIVPLPSGGKAYSTNSSLFNHDVVEITPMTAREEDILTSSALLKKGTVITELIRSCLVDKTINPNDLLVGDRNALMVAIRVTGYGADYDAEISCHECDAKAPQTFNLAELPIQRLEIEPVTVGMNLFEFTLPYTHKSVKFKFLTGRDEEEIMITQQKQKKLGLADNTAVTTNLLYSIVSVDGVEDRQKIAGFVRMMPARDSLALRNYIRDNEPGLKMKQEVSCPACGHAEEVVMPLGTSFLWPSAGR